MAWQRGNCGGGQKWYNSGNVLKYRPKCLLKELCCVKERRESMLMPEFFFYSEYLEG